MSGKKLRTKTSGQSKKDFIKNKRGRIVSKKAHAAGKRRFKKNPFSKWTTACVQARAKLGITGFKLVKKGTKYYKEAKKIYASLK